MSLSEQSTSAQSLPEDGLSHYGWTSISLHWIAAIAILVSYLTGEAMDEAPGDRAAYASHISWAALLAVPLVIRVVWRMVDGFKKTTDQAAIFNIASKVVMVGFLLAIVLSVLSGILLPWSLGNPLEVFSLTIPSPLPRMRELHEVMEETHEVATHAFIPLLVLHVAGALKHALIDKDGVLKGIFVPVKDR
jgi:cytochrome b561